MKKIIYLPMLLLITVMIIISCSKKIMFNASPIVPAATGNVKIKKDKNNNYEILITLKHLAPSKNLVPPREYYVVWIETETSGIKNIGQIASSSSLLSSTLKASLKAVTSFRPKSVFITAEENANIQYPGNQTVLKTDAFTVK